MSEAKWTVLAHVVRPQGRNGELLAEILTDFPERFADRKQLFVAKPGSYESAQRIVPQAVTLEHHWLHKGRIVLKFATVNSINDAELLRGLDVILPREERAPLEDDAVYLDDLLGCRVFDVRGEASGRVVGEIVDVDRDSTAGDLLVVKSEAGAEVLIPFVKAFLRRVDVAAQRIEMDLPEGLLELNAPATAEERAARDAEEEGS
jgi:16S rRNA processing protein RimM